MGISLIRINAIMSPLFGVCSGKVVAAERGAAQIEALPKKIANKQSGVFQVRARFD